MVECHLYTVEVTGSSPVSPTTEGFQLMADRIKKEHIDLWRKEGAVVVPEFFKSKEINAVVEDFQVIFPDRHAAAQPIDNKEKGANNFSAVKLNSVEASEKGASTTSGQAFMTPVKTIITSVKAVPNKDAK